MNGIQTAGKIVASEPLIACIEWPLHNFSYSFKSIHVINKLIWLASADLYFIALLSNDYYKNGNAGLTGTIR